MVEVSSNPEVIGMAALTSMSRVSFMYASSESTTRELKNDASTPKLVCATSSQCMYGLARADE